MRIKQIMAMMAEINASPLTMTDWSLGISSANRGRTKKLSFESAERKGMLISRAQKKRYADPAERAKQSQFKRPKWSVKEKASYKNALKLCKAPKPNLLKIAEDLGLSYYYLRLYSGGIRLTDLE